MIDFDELRRVNGSFVGTGTDMGDYKRWLKDQVCGKCGAKYADRKRDENGRCLDLWRTETDCGCGGIGEAIVK